MVRFAKRLISPIAIAIGLMLGFLPLGQAHASQADPKTSQTPYYLALGDSLSVGFDANGPGTGISQNGYVDGVFGTYSHLIPGLQLMDVGCAGATTTSMQGPAGCAFPATYAPGYTSPQLTEAENFLEHNRVALVTIDIGANDALRCQTLGAQNFPTCLSSVETNLNTILQGLRQAAIQGGNPDVPIVGMSYYDVDLVAWQNTVVGNTVAGLLRLAGFCSPGSSGQICAQQSVPFVVQLNSALSSAYADNHDPVADVQRVFKTQVPMVPLPPDGQPHNVTLLCNWTWMCLAGDIHANVTGYSVIADTFHTAIAGKPVALFHSRP